MINESPSLARVALAAIGSDARKMESSKMRNRNRKPYVSLAQKRRETQSRCGWLVIGSTVAGSASFLTLASGPLSLTATVAGIAVMVTSAVIASLAIAIGHSA